MIGRFVQDHGLEQVRIGGKAREGADVARISTTNEQSGLGLADDKRRIFSTRKDTYYLVWLSGFAEN